MVCITPLFVGLIVDNIEDEWLKPVMQLYLLLGGLLLIIGIILYIQDKYNFHILYLTLEDFKKK